MAGLGRVGFIGRFKPLHKGAALALELLCANADEVIIGIGSYGKDNMRNPFTGEESAMMIDLYLSPRYSNYKIIYVPDFAHIPQYSDGRRWKEYVVQNFGSLDYFVTGNDYTAQLLKDTYTILHPAMIIPDDKWVDVNSTIVRIAMARGVGWEQYVPDVVAEFLKHEGLIDRFQQRYGAATLAAFAHGKQYNKYPGLVEEIVHTYEA